MSPSIQELLDFGDHFALLKILRRHPSPQTRKEAARNLASLDHPDIPEGLIRAVLADQDPEVRAASRDALNELLGKQDAEMALTVYGQVEGLMPYEAVPVAQSQLEMDNASVEEDAYSDYDTPDEIDWGSTKIVHAEVPAEFLEFSAPDTSITWDQEHLASLILILQDDSQPDRQLKAIRVLAEHPTPASVDALSSAVLWSENPFVQKASREALESRYGAETDQLLADYRAAQLGSDSEEEDEEMLPDVSFTGQSSLRAPSLQSPPSIEPEGLSGRNLLFLLAVVFTLIMLAFWLLTK